MKNIHLIPTTKRSYLAIKDSNNKLELSEKNTFFINGFGFTPQHIYITSDEEIKEGDWVYCNIDNTIDIANDRTNYHRYEFQKIILTTDTKLIKDGVQAINDKFLEWFIKNPSCEFVEVKRRYSDFTVDPFVGYEIFIPKEEPKQVEIDWSRFPQSTKDAVGYIQPKQETPEEAAKNYAKGLDKNSAEDFINGANWQKERMYSEDEVKHIISEALQSALVTVDLEQWFEQHKKK